VVVANGLIVNGVVLNPRDAGVAAPKVMVCVACVIVTV
jgi:hypothetical protein